jgi:hypothetical protein
VGYSWVLYLGFNWATYVYSLVYLEAHDAFFYIYIYITLLIKKKKEAIWKVVPTFLMGSIWR